MIMKRCFLACGLLLAAFYLTVYAEEKQESLPAAPQNVGLDKMKTLVGTWVAADENGKATDQVVSVIKLTAGGSAIQETLFPGQPHEMISMYTVDGPDLVLTHYCVLGNQPRMKASPKADDDKLKFEFIGGENLDVKKDKHMHGATLTIVDADHIQIDGIGWDKGEPTKEMCCGMKLLRQK
jgi:hypothetical protein